MREISGYKINSQMYESNRTIVYKAIRKKDKVPVILKVLKKEYPSAEDLTKFKNEYEILNRIKELSGVIRSYDLLEYKNSLIIVMEDFNGEPLDRIITNDKIGLKSFLGLAINIATAVGNIHRQQIIHKDIKPYNIIVNKKNNEVRIIDFSLSTQITKETQNLINPDKIEGTLSYISPEQTGRMNRSINYRSDYYSMGITFYQMLTGRLPFVSNDPLELVHFHIAKIPQTPHELNKSIPKSLSDIIMKLLSKNAEERYQSINGLLYDLNKCLGLLIKKNKITNFKIAENDLSDNFQIPEKLYGRDKEIELLIERFNNAYNGGKEVLLFSGPPGIGKSALVKEIHKLLAEKSGFFIEGKFDQYKKNIPYSAIIQAFSMLAKQILTEREEKIKVWKKLILEKVGSIGKIITDAVPDFELIIGKQSDVQELPPTEAQNRFNTLIQSFIKVFAREHQPLVMFIDDMQWIDDAGMKLLEKTVGDRELHNFLFIGSYRDSDVDKSHPLTRIMAKMENRDEISREYLKLAPLDGEHTAELLADTFYLDIKKTKELANILIEKTDGNPFFINTFLKTLIDDKLITFDNGWLWDINKIKKANVTSNVVELMSKNIKKLDKKTWDILKLAACFGGKFTINTLSQIYGKDKNETFYDLKNAVNEGMILKIGDDYKFVHDRIKEAAISLIDEEELKAIHYKIGMTFLKNIDKENLENKIFDIASQLNSSKDLLNDEEKNELIEINLKAAYRAKESGAFDAALKFLNESCNILSPNPWESNYNLALRFYTELAEAEYLTANFQEAEELFEIILKNTKTIYDKINIYSLMITNFSNQLKYKDALETGKKALKYLNISIPMNPTPLSVFPDILKSKLIIGNRKISNLAKLPKMENPSKIAAMKILMACVPPAYIYNPNLFPILVMKMVNLSIKYGLSPLSSYSFVAYGIILAGALGNIESGYEFGKLSIIVTNMFNQKFLQGKIYFHYTWINHWKNHARENLDLLLNTYTYCLESGDFEYLGYFFFNYGFTNFLIGHNLQEVKDIFTEYFPLVNKFKQRVVYFNIWYQTILNILEKSKKPTKLRGQVFDEEKSLPEILKSKDNSAIAFYYLNKIILCYLFEEYNEGLSYVQIGEKHLSGILCMFPFSIFYQFYALLLAAKIKKGDKDFSKNFKKLKKITKKFETWKDYCKENYLHKYYLLNAEIFKINENYSKAEKFYELSIENASLNGFVQDEAIANECAAKFYISRNLNKLGVTYINESRYCYQKWGANTKIKYLEKNYSRFFQGYLFDDVFTKKENYQQTLLDRLNAPETSSSSSKSILLDIETIIKSTQAISSEIEMEKLLEKLIRIAIENAGAQKGFLILIDKNNNLFIEAEGQIDKDGVVVLQSKPIDDSKNVSPAIIRYCAKTKENVVLNNASKEGMFITDEYIIKNRPKSILCTPIIKQTKLVGLLYLENNLTANAFPEERVEILKILSSQIAISIENSKLIDDLKEQERLKQEMVIAEQIQTSLIPIIPEDTDFEIVATIKPTEEVGGDYFDIIFDKEKNLWFAIGDVSGHGVTPGLIMMMAQTAINSNLLGAHRTTPSSILKEVNRVLYENIRNRIKKNHYMTLSLMKYLGNGDFIYSGLHLDIIIYRSKTKKCELIYTSGVYLGILADIKKHTTDDSFHLDKNDIMILYTDGIIEAMNNKDQMLGIKGLTSIIEENAENNSLTLKKTILNKTLEWCNNKVVDDITLLVIKRK